MNVQKPDDWWRKARCRHAPRGLFITNGDDDDEPAYPPPEATRYCTLCPVIPECLAYALEDSNVVGVWGNTTSFQRKQMRRKMNRSKCLGCGADDSIVGEGNQELCLACGVSWHVY